MAELRIRNDEAARRRENHRQYFLHLCEIKQDLDDLRSSAVDDDTLGSLGIYRGEELDVDESNGDDCGPRYFSPLPTEYLPDIAELLEKGSKFRPWPKKCIADT